MPKFSLKLLMSSGQSDKTARPSETKATRTTRKQQQIAKTFLKIEGFYMPLGFSE